MTKKKKNYNEKAPYLVKKARVKMIDLFALNVANA